MNRKLLDSLPAFCEHFGFPLYDWQLDAFGEACKRRKGRFVHRLAGVSVPRGNGKSWAGASAGLWRLIAGKPPVDILSVALDFEGAKVLLDHAKRMVRSHPELERAVKVKDSELVVESTGSRWTVAPSAHTSSRGRHPDLILYDECGWSRDDELFSSLLAGQASVEDPLMLVVSTVGRKQSGPLWTVKLLHEGGDDGVYWYWSGDNPSPKVTKAFLERQRKILVPAQFAREHQNAWVDAADSYLSAEHVDRAMSHPWGPQPHGSPGVEYHCFVDLGVINDPSVIAVGHTVEGIVYVDELLTFQGTRRNPVQLDTIESTLLDLSARFSITSIRIESWQGMASVQRLEHVLPVELFTPTPKTNSEEWSLLAQHFAEGRVIIPAHARLREELLNLTVEVGPSGAKVTDKGKVHQDHAVAVRGVVASLATLGTQYVAAVNLSHTATRDALAPVTGDTRFNPDDRATWVSGYQRDIRDRTRMLDNDLLGLGRLGRLI